MVGARDRADVCESGEEKGEKDDIVEKKDDRVEKDEGRDVGSARIGCCCFCFCCCCCCCI